MPLGCDDFVFRKVNLPLPLRRGKRVGFRLTTKLPLSVTQPNFWRSLKYNTIFIYDTLYDMYNYDIKQNV